MATTPDPGLSAELTARLDDALQMWNRQEFFEAHEVMEEIWNEDTSEAASFVQGLLCAAVGFAKLDVDRPAGTQKMMVRANEFLLSYVPRYLGFDVQALIDAFERCRVEAEKVVAHEKPEFNRALIPRLERSA